MFLPTELPSQSTLNSHTLKKKLFLDWKMKNCKLFLDLQKCSFGSHRITEWLGLEGTSKIIYPQLSIILESTLAFQKSFWALTGPVGTGLPPTVPTRFLCLDGVRTASATIHKEDCPSPLAVFNPMQNAYFRQIYTWLLLQPSFSCIFPKFFSWEQIAIFYDYKASFPKESYFMKCFFFFF